MDKPKFFIQLIIISIISKITSIKTRDKKLNNLLPEIQTILTIYDYGQNRTSYILTPKNGIDIIDDKISFRISYLTDKNLSLIEKYSKYFNRRWTFFTEDKEIISYLIEKYNKTINSTNKNFTIFGIIFPKKLNYTQNEIISFPLYEIEDKYINDFISFDIKNQTKNTYFIISERSIIYQNPIKYLLITSIIFLIISIFILCVWNYKFKKIQNILSLQKNLIFLPYLNLILSILICLQTNDMIKENSNKKNNNALYIETGLFTVNAIFRALMWILYVLTCSGWQISKQNFSYKEIKHFIIIFVFIYLIMCIDQIVDSFNTAKTIIKANEIKNLIFYMIMIIYNTIKGINTINFLKRKLQYSNIFNTIHFIPALKIKIKMMKSNIILIYIFTFLFIVMMTIHKFFFIIYDTQNFEMIEYHYLDVIFMIGILYIFRPMKLPDYFDFDYGEDINENSKVFKCKIEKVDNFCDKKYNQNINKNDLQLYLNENIPVVIVNPIFGQKINGTNIDTYICKSQIGYFSEN